nr:MAG TPA: hypothetical protein [Bacteriophage sp.]
MLAVSIPLLRTTVLATVQVTLFLTSTWNLLD